MYKLLKINEKNNSKFFQKSLVYSDQFAIMNPSKGNQANHEKGDKMNKSTEQALATMFSVGSFTASKSSKNEMKAVEELSEKFAAWTSLDDSGSHVTINLRMTQWAINRIEVKD